jgi:transposase InsO family protein
LAEVGLDAGPDTICWHLRHHHDVRVSPAMVSRCLAWAGLVTPAPKKRPRSSDLRFAAQLPNECWQSDVTHYPLADGTSAEILSRIDDHARYAFSVTAHRRVTGPIVGPLPVPHVNSWYARWRTTGTWFVLIGSSSPNRLLPPVVTLVVLGGGQPVELEPFDDPPHRR